MRTPCARAQRRSDGTAATPSTRLVARGPAYWPCSRGGSVRLSSARRPRTRRWSPSVAGMARHRAAVAGAGTRRSVHAPMATASSAVDASSAAGLVRRGLSLRRSGAAATNAKKQTHRTQRLRARRDEAAAAAQRTPQRNETACEGRRPAFRSPPLEEDAPPPPRSPPLLSPSETRHPHRVRPRVASTRRRRPLRRSSPLSLSPRRRLSRRSPSPPSSD